ncbi:hypothetical protein K0M31_016728 [Melipona bicolor]|uniref:Uncharacterized protein n=1 Tax=Melipona bicolor TaxID=60889 RepID=A0AA40FE92_9HYME|nr:hypothetical protein K0M31_016728 [Melipona bicolor]
MSLRGGSYRVDDGSLTGQCLCRREGGERSSSARQLVGYHGRGKFVFEWFLSRTEVASNAKERQQRVPIALVFGEGTQQLRKTGIYTYRGTLTPDTGIASFEIGCRPTRENSDNPIAELGELAMRSRSAQICCHLGEEIAKDAIYFWIN